MCEFEVGQKSLKREGSCIYGCDKGNSCPHFGHFAALHCTEDGQAEQAKALPYVMSKAKRHFGQATIRL
jgi:hypothetical protein